jgi:hypothetical protein
MWAGAPRWPGNTLMTPESILDEYSISYERYSPGEKYADHLKVDIDREDLFNLASDDRFDLMISRNYTGRFMAFDAPGKMFRQR